MGSSGDWRTGRLGDEGSLSDTEEKHFAFTPRLENLVAALAAEHVHVLD
jgi:hypothetical protein